MKRFLFIAVVFAALAAVSTQEAAAQNENNMTISVAGWRVELNGKDSKYKRHKPSWYFGRIGTFELGVSGFRATPAAYKNYPAAEAGFMDLMMERSFHATINMFLFSTPITRNHKVGLTMGVGASVSNYVFESQSAYVIIDRQLRPSDAGHPLKKAKMLTGAIHFPLAIEVQPNRNFFFSIGGYVDFVPTSYMKWKKPKEYLMRLPVNPLQAGATLRIGTRHAYAFGSYSFVEMFQNGRGPVLNPYSFGIGFGF